MTITYLSTLALPGSWFAQLRLRMPGVRVLHLTPEEAAAAPSEVLCSINLLHTSEWFPEPEQVPALGCVQLDTSGVDHVRGTALWKTDVPIATLGGIAPVPMAEYAMMTVLELAHRMPLIEQHRATRTWPSNADRLSALTPKLLPGATMGIVGYGRIGREISRLATAFGMNVVGLSRTGCLPRADVTFNTGHLTVGGTTTELLPMGRLDEVLTRSDILIVVVPLTELTRGMIGAEQLDLLPEGALVVNIARGGIVDEDALIERLRDGRIAGVALDVFDEEPLPISSDWWTEPGALITPHVAGLSPEYHAQTLDLVVENLTRLAEGQPIVNEVDRAAGY